MASWAEEKVPNSRVNEKSASASDLGSGFSGNLSKAEESLSEMEEAAVVDPFPKEVEGRKSGKRKHKVDWTPELHKRFVQAVEQLGLEKAVPSKIVELMGINCLTRHNVASHLQKYRSRRRRSLARETEVGGLKQRPDTHHWTVHSTMGFPLPYPPPPYCVWGVPSIDQQPLRHMWPRHPSASPPLMWPPSQPLVDPYFWYYPSHQYTHQAPLPGMPQADLYRLEPGFGKPPGPLPPSSPSKECLGSAIEDVLANPWLPLPLGLKPPSVDGVLVELQRRGISKIPPAAARV